MVEYDGRGFAGWQQQPGKRTVEGELKRALKELTGHDHVVHAAGRTDAGAHALGQVVSFDLRGGIPVRRLRAALDSRLPEDVAALRAEAAPEGFHARYSARWRRYRYRFLERPARPALERGRCWHLGRRVDVPAMRQAAQALVGRHDWTSFCSASEPPAGRVRELRRATVRRRAGMVELELEADGFLRGLARGIAGALAEVGVGRRPPGWPAELLRAKDRRQAPRTAPAAGLYLVDVLYD
ncbi:MAG TPA: tRNA pseudouridine(38-40) synthase TruA [Candidatus Acidoferrales bacterium]|nr:tRNA pseudouridine(38-40) synthase TruA [Candidatus Acidoferrales bacterium]